MGFPHLGVTTPHTTTTTTAFGRLFFFVACRARFVLGCDRHGRGGGRTSSVHRAVQQLSTGTARRRQGGDGRERRRRCPPGVSDYGVSEGGPARQTDRQTSPGSGSPVTCLQAAAAGSARMIRPPRYLTPLRSSRHSLPCPSGPAPPPCRVTRAFATSGREREKLTPSGPRRSCRPSESKGAAAAAAAGQHANDPVGRGHAVGVARRFFLQPGPGWTSKDAPCGGRSVGGQDAHQKRGAQGGSQPVPLHITTNLHTGG